MQRAAANYAHPHCDSSSRSRQCILAAAAGWIACGCVAGCQILAVATLIYHNALSNGLSMSISCFMSSKTLYRPCHPSTAPGALERHQNTHAPLRPEQGAIEAIKRQLLCGAASRPRRRVLAGLAPFAGAKTKRLCRSTPKRAKWKRWVCVCVCV